MKLQLVVNIDPDNFLTDPEKEFFSMVESALKEKTASSLDIERMLEIHGVEQDDIDSFSLIEE